MNKIKIQLHKNICEDLHQLYKDKNDDYGDSFAFTRNRYGKIATLTRLVDKILRVERLILSADPMKVQDEKIDDTLLDLANYSIMELLEMRFEIIQALELRTQNAEALSI